ncbi:hypothetical protein LCGC14_2683810 [marine sediment metagenome]|uniref:Uncharacterized protein n=1 Tax=marine sediment metagenome TaxID=412755 RepID=A0A0F8ZKI4_9ZZZZ
MPRYWITPPEIYKELDKEFHFDFDPCPNPRPDGYNSLVLPWGHMNYCNPPFRKTDGNTDGPTAFVRKAISEQAKGKATVLLLPAQSYINLLLEAGAELRAAGRTRFLDVDTGEPLKVPSPTILAILTGGSDANS